MLIVLQFICVCDHVVAHVKYGSDAVNVQVVWRVCDYVCVDGIKIYLNSFFC